MSEGGELDQPDLDLMVNGVTMEARLRFHPEAPEGFDVIVEDPFIGTFALHDQFDLLLRESGSEWRPASLDELRKILAKAAGFLEVEDLPTASEAAARKLFDRFDDVDATPRKPPRLGKITGHHDCMRRVQELLYEARIPHRVAGAVFVVPNVSRTRIVLRRAGFEKSKIAPAALEEPRSGCAIQLIERRL